ncbi:MAG TPA: DMT family transporter [Dongiaceae bacterium]|nr:DMT family transporter [Dongiaceae bacterium]
MQTAGRRRYWLGLGLILIACCLLSIISTFARLAYQSGATPTTLLWLRFSSFTVVIGALLILRRRRLRLTARQLLGTAVMAVGMLMNSVGYLGSVAYISIGLSVVLFYTFPLITVALSALIGAEKPSFIKILCVAGAFCGVLLASANAIGGTFDWRGVALILIGALGFAGAIVYGNARMQGVAPLTMNLWMNLWMVAVMSGAIFLVPGTQAVLGAFTWPTGALAWFGTAAATGCYILGFSCFFAAVQMLPPSQTGIMMNLEPIIATTSAMLVLGEKTQPLQWLGMAVIIVSLGAASVLGARRSADRQPAEAVPQEV